MRQFLLGSIAFCLMAPAALHAQCASAPCGVVLPTSAATGSVASAALGETDMRLETRLYSQNWAAAGAAQYINVGGFKLTYIPTALYWNFPGTSDATDLVCDMTGQTDALVRIQMNSTDEVASLEVNDTETGDVICSYSDFVLTFDSNATIQAAGVSVGGDVDVTGSVGFIRWFDSVVAIGTAIPVGVASPADLGDWEFASNLTDTSGLAQNLTGTVTYSDEPVYAPAIQAGPIQVTRTAVGTVTMAASCTPLDGGTTATWLWTLNSAPVAPTITTSSSPTSTITGMTAFGTYSLNAKCTDSLAQESNLTVKAGAVVADSQGRIDLAAEGLPSGVEKIIGQPIAYGMNPWEWADNRQAETLSRQIELNLVSPYYFPFWRTTIGTVTVVEGSNIATATAGADLRDMCSGGSTPDAGAVITLKFTGTDAETYYTYVTPTSCTDATHVVLNWQNNDGAYDANGLAPFPACGGGGCSMDWDWGSNDHNFWAGWILSGSPGNYYDNIKSMYLMYARTGIDTFHEAFQDQADIWWEMPAFNKGYGCYTFTQASNTCWSQRRQYALDGVFLRALELGAADPIWDGLYVVMEGLRNYLTNIPLGTPAEINLDAREAGYATTYVAFCATLCPDSAEKTLNRTALKDALTDVWDSATYHRADLGSASYPGYGSFYATLGSAAGSSITAAAFGGQGTACVTNGSTAVVGTGTVWVSQAGKSIWFFGGTTSVLPATNATGDTTYYTGTTVTDNTHLTLNRAYEGTTGCSGVSGSDKGYVFGDTGGLVAWGSQAWPMGFAAMAAYDAGIALQVTDPTESADYFALLQQDALWILTYGRYGGDEKGLVNGMFFPGCTPPITAFTLNCAPDDIASAYRTLSLDVMRGLSAAYLESRNSVIKTGVDAMMTEMFAAPGYDSLAAGDGSYINEFDDGATYMTGTGGAAPGGAPKWTGQLCGIQEACSMWPAARLYELPTAPRYGKVQFRGLSR